MLGDILFQIFLVLIGIICTFVAVILNEKKRLVKWIIGISGVAAAFTGILWIGFLLGNQNSQINSIPEIAEVEVTRLVTETITEEVTVEIPQTVEVSRIAENEVTRIVEVEVSVTAPPKEVLGVSTATPQPNTPTPIPTNTITPEPMDNPYLTINNNINYTLVEASHDGNEGIFWFIALNEGPDASICLRFSSFLIDSNGNTHNVTNRIGGGRSGGLDCLTFTAARNVPTRFGLAFNTLSPEATQIPFIQVTFGIGDGNAQFRDIPIPFQAEGS